MPGSFRITIAGSEPGKISIRMREPSLSETFVAQKGFTGIEIACPVLSGDGTYSGSIIVMEEPSAFVGETVYSHH